MTPTTDRASWMAAWRHAVRATPGGVGLVELDTGRFVEVTHEAAALLGTTPDRAIGVPYYEFADRPDEAELTFEMARGGRIESLISRRSYRDRDGRTVEVTSSAHVIRAAAGSALGLWLVDDGNTGTTGTCADALVAQGASAVDAWIASVDVVDGRWTIVAGAHDLLGTALVDLVDGSDRPVLLGVLARATTAASARAVLSLRRERRAPEVTEPTVVSVNSRDRCSYDITLTPMPGGVALASERIEQLPPRRREVLDRLLRGERVATIAKEMYLSRSTVRNHLAAIFRTFDVHSQDELLNLVRTGKRTPQA